MPQTTYTDEQLKRVLVKMLPDEMVSNVFHHPVHGDRTLYTRKEPYRWCGEDNDHIIKDTELLDLVWRVESKLTIPEQANYVTHIWQSNKPEDFKGGYEYNQFSLSNLIWWTLTHATWQQRTIALAKTLRIEIV